MLACHCFIPPYVLLLLLLLMLLVLTCHLGQQLRSLSPSLTHLALARHDPEVLPEAQPHVVALCARSSSTFTGGGTAPACNQGQNLM